MLPLPPDDYDQHIIETYVSTRIGIAIISLLLPLILLIGGNFSAIENFQGDIFGLGVLGSFSAYYHSPLRNVFVGILFAIGTSLWLYKGYSTFEDFTLDVAGILAICVALLPTSCPVGNECNTFTAPHWHGVVAISFFILIALICVAEAFGFLHRSKIPSKYKSKSKSKSETRCKSLYKLFTTLYIALAISMFVLPFSAWLFYRGTGIATFKIELAAVLVFSIYWIVKTIEINIYSLETSGAILAQINSAQTKIHK